jgi:glycerol-3-phosphate cytidylyltransferase|tara:strand:+ start:459 stop:770 length:312 start_codon:yes stop_codon:yes gene_type:complete
VLALETHLTVALSTDQFDLSKGKEAKFSWGQRKLDIEGVRYVNDIIPKGRWEQKVTDVTTREPDVFTISDDWEGEFDFLKEHSEVVYLGRTLNISSTMSATSR